MLLVTALVAMPAVDALSATQEELAVPALLAMLALSTERGAGGHVCRRYGRGSIVAGRREGEDWTQAADAGRTEGLAKVSQER